MPPKWRRRFFQSNLTKSNFFSCYQLTDQIIKHQQFIKCKNNSFFDYILLNLKNSSQYQINFDFMKCFFIFFFLFNICATKSASALKYERELKYLEYYMGIAPANDEGNIYVNEELINKYISKPTDLNCDLHSPPYLWTNANSDGLLDTSNFYLFDKVNTKNFPIQVQPGIANSKPGTLFLFAGNTTNDPQSALFMSAPVLCQNYDGILTFEYWLYNKARIEVMLLKVNPSQGRLQVIERLNSDCNFFKYNGLCRVEIPKIFESFRIGIRVFGIGDANLGSFAMIKQIRYDAVICSPNNHSKIFSGFTLSRILRPNQIITTASELDCEDDNYAIVATKKKLNINKKNNRCLWAAAFASALINININENLNFQNTQWSIGSDTQNWDQFFRIKNRPIGEFYYQIVDPMADVRQLTQLRSALIPCTQTSSALKFKYWLSIGVQAQLCTLSISNVELSCVYLNEIDSPGPITIDIDSADKQPFKFAFSIIKFSTTNGGIFAIDEIKYTGYLCNEKILHISSQESFLTSQELKSRETYDDTDLVLRQYRTSIKQKNNLEELFKLKPFPIDIENVIKVNKNEQNNLISPFNEFSKLGNKDRSETLDCDFETEFCLHWLQDYDEENLILMINDNKKNELLKKIQFQYGSVPTKESFLNEPLFKGNVAIAAFSDIKEPSSVHHSNNFETRKTALTKEYAIFTSQVVSCANNAQLSVLYYSSKGASLSICADTHCVTQKQAYGNLSVTVSAQRSFRLHILASTKPELKSPYDYLTRYSNTLPSDHYRRPFRYRYLNNKKFIVPLKKNNQIDIFSLPPFILIKKIQTNGGFCHIETLTESSCKILSCNFEEQTMCQYQPVVITPNDAQFVITTYKGIMAHLSEKTGLRAILRSPKFKFSSAADLRFDVILTTFGTRLYICPNDETIFLNVRSITLPFSNVLNASNLFNVPIFDNLSTLCELVLGPKIKDDQQIQRIQVQLDESIEHFMFIAVHDTHKQFGDAHVFINNVALISENSNMPLC